LLEASAFVQRSQAQTTQGEPSTPQVVSAVPDLVGPEKTDSTESHTASSDCLDFTSEARRNKAVADYTKRWTTAQWTCSQASLGRVALVHPADLSKWKSGSLPADSEKKKRIEAALRNNQEPTGARKKSADK
jgi:hypothetical protein